MLRKERDLFMKKLEISRNIRSRIEKDACVIIQKKYRGHFVRHKRADETREKCLRRKEAYSTAMEIVKEMAPDLVLTGMEDRKRYTDARYKSALLIQRIYKKCISRRQWRYRDLERKLEKRRLAVVRIQCMARICSSRARVSLVRSRALLTKTRHASTMIQKHVRRMFARRRVRKRRLKLWHVAARMIQGWYRAKKAKIKSLKIKEIVLQTKQFLGAQGMQCLIRRKVARGRVNRIRLRRLYLYLFEKVTRMQCLIRKYLSTTKVRSLRQNKKYNAEMEVLKLKEKGEKDAIIKDLDDHKNASEASDIFLQAKDGDVDGFEKIASGQILLENGNKHQMKDVDDEGNTALHVAVMNGHSEIVAKCCDLGYAFSSRNAAKLTPLMQAVKEGNVDLVANCILQPPVKFKLDKFNPEDSAFMIVASLQQELKNEPRDRSYEMYKAIMAQGMPVIGKDSHSGMYPIHAACHVGNIDAFRALLKAKAVTDKEDDENRLPLHYACCSSLPLVKMLLGIDSSAGILVPDSKRAHLVIKSDNSAKDCRILAALYGQNGILKFCTELVSNNREAVGADAKAKENEGVEWMPADYDLILRLVKDGNVECVEYLKTRGLNLTWTGEDMTQLALGLSSDGPGVTIAMQACKYGNLAFIDYLMDMNVNFVAPKDLNGLCAVHYAAQCSTESVIAHLISHKNAQECGIDEMALVLQDNEGQTPLHTAAFYGIAIKIDLLASKGISAALLKKDKHGLTPLALAAKRYNTDVLLSYLNLGADATVLDNAGCNIIWHLFNAVNPEKINDERRKPVCSELKGPGVQGKKTREAAAATLKNDVIVLVELVKAGCPLYDKATVTLEELENTPFTVTRDPTKKLDVELISQYAPGDILVQELSLTALSALVKISSLGDCWRLALSSIRFDSGNQKCLLTLLDAGLSDKLVGTPTDDIREKNSPETMSQLSGKDVTYGGMNIAGWAIKLRNIGALQKMLRKGGYNPALPADVMGNSCLHMIARYGQQQMVDMALADDRMMIEAENAQGNTALMEAAKAGNYLTARRLVSLHASARRGLCGKYWAWLLLMARRQERTENNLQTGRIGDDDTSYFPADEPCWYESAMNTPMMSTN